MSLAQDCIFTQEKGGISSYEVRPLVIFNILDNFQRRNPEQARVVGTLLGQREGNTVVVTNCFPVPHTETEDSVALNVDFHTKFLEMYSRVNPDEVVVGWYSTGNELRYTSSLIHVTYETEHNETSEPLMLQIDTSLGANGLSVKGYTAQNIESAGRRLFTKFVQVPLDIKSSQSESVAVDALVKGNPEKSTRPLDVPSTQLSEFDSLFTMLTRLRASLGNMSQYLDSVVDGKVVGDAAVGAAIANAISAMPHLNTAALEPLAASSMQDLLMSMYLSNLTNTHIQLADRIHSLAMFQSQ